MANLLMHPRADSLTFLFTIQRGCKRVEGRWGVGWGGGGVDERTENGGKGEKKETKCCFPFNHPVVSCPHSCCALQDATLQACWLCLRRRSSVGHVGARGSVVGDERRLLVYLFGHSGLLLDILLLNGNQCPETSLHLEDGGSQRSVMKSEW